MSAPQNNPQTRLKEELQLYQIYQNRIPMIYI